MTPEQKIRALGVHAKTLRQRSKLQSPVEISPEMAVDLAIACEELAEYQQELLNSERVPSLVERRA